MPDLEHHRSHRIGWLRAAVLGANDGIVSTASLMIGMAAGNVSHSTLILSGVAALVAGAMSMAAGEYVSVSSQADTEEADLALEIAALKNTPQFELDELRDIYIERGLTPDLATQVAQQLTEKDALGAHARDELGIVDTMRAKPFQAAQISALSFAVGSVLPLCIAFVAPQAYLQWSMGITSLIFLAILGGVSAYTGGANIWKGVSRVTFWGAIAMLATWFIGRWFGSWFGVVTA